MILIFCLSSQNAQASSKTSGGLIEKVLNVVYPNFENLQTEEKENIISNFQYIVRKTAHFSIYFALSKYLCYEETAFNTKLLYAALPSCSGRL